MSKTGSLISIAIGLVLIILGFLRGSSGTPLDSGFFSEFSQGGRIWLMAAGQIALAAGLFRLARAASE